MRYLIKQNDEARNTTTTLADDGELTVALAAGTTYFIDMLLMADSGATPGLKYLFTYTGTLTSAATWEGANNSIAPGTGGSGDGLGPCYNFGQISILTNRARTGSATAGTLLGGHVRGVIVTNTAGNLKIQWAQNTSDAGNTTVHKGSYIGFATQADMDGTLLIKGSDTSRASTTTLAADPDIQFTTEANKKYVYEMLFIGDANSITPDLKIAFHDANVSLSAGFIQVSELNGNTVFSSSSDANIRGQWAAASFITTPTTGVKNTQTTANKVAVQSFGSHQMAGSAGTFAVEWAQNASNATPTIARAPSWLLYQEIS